MNQLEELVRRRDQSDQRWFDLYQRAGLIGQVLQPFDAKRILSFVETDYLGFRKHPRLMQAACNGAKQTGLSAGVPRVFGQDELCRRLEHALAQLVQQERASLFSSTTHIALDLLPILAGKDGVIFIDAWAYPISCEGAQAAARYRTKIKQFAHNDTNALESLLKSHRHIRDKVIVCDGVYSAGGKKAALKDFSQMADRFGAVIYVDDAHGLGIVGADPAQNPPFGVGGGGTHRFENVPAGNYVYVASLSKAFGVPLAFAAGPATFIEFLNRSAKSFVHASPPALPMVAAALASLAVNRMEGKHLRKLLALRVQQFIQGFEVLDAPLAHNGSFPIQSLYYSSPRAAWKVAKTLRRNGVWPLFQIAPIDFPTGAVLRFLLSAKHAEGEIQRVHDLFHDCRNRETVAITK